MTANGGQAVWVTHLSGESLSMQIPISANSPEFVRARGRAFVREGVPPYRGVGYVQHGAEKRPRS